MLDYTQNMMDWISGMGPCGHRFGPKDSRVTQAGNGLNAPWALGVYPAAKLMAAA